MFLVRRTRRVSGVEKEFFFVHLNDRSCTSAKKKKEKEEKNARVNDMNDKIRLAQTFGASSCAKL